MFSTGLSATIVYVTEVLKIRRQAATDGRASAITGRFWLTLDTTLQLLESIYGHDDNSDERGSGLDGGSDVNGGLTAVDAGSDAGSDGGSDVNGGLAAVDVGSVAGSDGRLDVNGGLAAAAA
ncbi:hypothetical protein Tco_1195385 [Tanacetum coccineum]